MTELQLLIRRLKEVNHYGICEKCFQEVDLRKPHGQHQGGVCHHSCPPIRPKYT